MVCDWWIFISTLTHSSSWFWFRYRTSAALVPFTYDNQQVYQSSYDFYLPKTWFPPNIIINTAYFWTIALTYLLDNWNRRWEGTMQDDGKLGLSSDSWLYWQGDRQASEKEKNTPQYYPTSLVWMHHCKFITLTMGKKHYGLYMLSLGLFFFSVWIFMALDLH